ncbi:hypothetical protein TYRP_012065 [Tyrophagus putrescentiae]|nr:hypothetical protein TYRP_012065 [Tyrophagus putrescentiae]
MEIPTKIKTARSKRPFFSRLFDCGRGKRYDSVEAMGSGGGLRLMALLDTVRCILMVGGGGGGDDW